jgi:uncharacterized membrane protein YesL
MDIEKLVNSKVYTFFDWIWRLFVLNVFTMISLVGVVTAFPGVVACYQSIKDYKEGTEESVHRVFLRNFKQLFKKTVVMGIIIIVTSVVLIYATLYYSDLLVEMSLPDYNYTDMQMLLPTIGKYIAFFCIFLLVIIVNQLPIIYSYFNFRFFDNFRFALYMAFKFFFQGLFELITWVLSVVVFFWLTPIWFFIGITFPMYAIYSISRPTYWYLANSKDVLIHDKNEEKERK